ncbi:hypothetical protein [Enterobacter kobei]|uniref:hypothetical protein n=1 Tax=Enterobacter kobei TaxID=208224 RepID=UPI0012B8FA0A|nr:hypothetical protein [Enterobacter kobei]
MEHAAFLADVFPDFIRLMSVSDSFLKAGRKKYGDMVFVWSWRPTSESGAVIN